MGTENILYDVYKTIVAPGLEVAFIPFIKDLDNYLLITYPQYYAGLQLYQDQFIPNLFHVVAAYHKVPGLSKVSPIISTYITNRYDHVFGPSVIRTCVLSFHHDTRIHPPERI